MTKEYIIRFGINIAATMEDNETCRYYKNGYKQIWVNNKLEPITGIAKNQRGSYTYFINGNIMDTGTKENFNIFLKEYVFK